MYRRTVIEDDRGQGVTLVLVRHQGCRQGPEKENNAGNDAAENDKTHNAGVLDMAHRTDVRTRDAGKAGVEGHEETRRLARVRAPFQEQGAESRRQRQGNDT